MKAFVNLLIQSDAYSDPEEIADAVLAYIEESSLDLKVLWHKSSEVKDKNR